MRYSGRVQGIYFSYYSHNFFERSHPPTPKMSTTDLARMSPTALHAVVSRMLTQDPSGEVVCAFYAQCPLVFAETTTLFIFAALLMHDPTGAVACAFYARCPNPPVVITDAVVAHLLLHDPTGATACAFYEEHSNVAPSVVHAIVGCLLQHDPTGEAAVALCDRRTTATVTTHLEDFLFTAITYGNIALFTHVAAVLDLESGDAYNVETMCKNAVFCAHGDQVFAFPDSPDAQLVAQAALRLYCRTRAHGQPAYLYEVDDCLSFLCLLTSQGNAQLNAVAYEFVPVGGRLPFVLNYTMLAGTVPPGIDWTPLFTATTAPQLVKRLSDSASVLYALERWETSSFTLSAVAQLWQTSSFTLSAVAQLWQQCGFPRLPTCGVWRAWNRFLHHLYKKAVPETTATKLLREHIQYSCSITSFAHALYLDVELFETMIVTAKRRGDRLLTLPISSDTTYEAGAPREWPCRGVRLALQLATEVYLKDDDAATMLDYLFTSEEVTDPIFVAGLRHGIATLSKGARGTGVADILSKYAFASSLRGAWVSACVLLGHVAADAELEEEPAEPPMKKC